MTRQQIMWPVIAIIGVISFGTVGYALIEDWSIFDALYMTVITLTTVGYEEVHLLSKAGKSFTIILILTGVGAMLYALSVATKALLEGKIREILGRKKLSKRIENTKNHYIICGYGRMGKIIAREMISHGSPFVVVEKSPEILAAMDKDILSVQGDSTQDDVLKLVGIERARGLISVLSSDADNLYVVLSARGLNPKLKIVARAGEEGVEQKLIRAGADNVISPYNLGGLRIAHTVLKPAVVDFLEFATRSGNLELQIEEIQVKDSSHIVDKGLDECGIRKELGIIVVAIKRATGEMEFNPTSTSVIRQGDTLIAMGETKQLKSLEDLVGV
ncbi:voltage-gated potassium channel Kch [bacterium BMS3Abin10]|nr:voltage-gated potassium channel Kch [bacterium BMS3Abin10]GBE39521.1 voltage-gated potassium channel Kch [bacterium BMS3Bbin08]